MSDRNRGGPGNFDDDWELDLDGAGSGGGGGGGAIVPPPPGGGGMPAPGGAQRYYVKRSSGKVFGPFLDKAIRSMLEQNKLSGAEQVSLDSHNWMDLSQVPALAAYARGGGGGAIVPPPPGGGAIVPPPPGGDDLVDLPGLPARGQQDVVDLPGLPSSGRARGRGGGGAIVPPPPGGGGPGFLDDFQPGGELDLAPGGGYGGDADLPAPVGSPNRGLTDLPGLPSQYRGGGGHPGAPVGNPHGDGFELSSMPGEELPELADLPAPKVGPGNYSSGPGITDLPGGGYSDLTDLPAPVGAQPGLTDLPAPVGRGGAQPGLTDLPAPVGHGGPGLTDLPGPVGHGGGPGLTDLPGPVGHGGGPGLTDLPAPAGHSAQPPATGLEYGEINLGDDSAALELDDLPVPAGGPGGGVVGLPAPSGGVGLPAPAGGIDLPAPSGGVGLPAPSGGVGLPAPSGGVGLPAPSGGIDLPTPSPGVDLPTPALGGTGLPGGTIDLPTPAVGGGGVGGLPAGTIDLPTPAGGQTDLLAPRPGEPGGLAHIDVVAPKYDGDDEIVRFDAPQGAGDPGALTADAAVSVDAREADLDALEQRRGRSRKPRGKAGLMIGVGAGVFIIVAGLAMGLLTDYGFFGINLITGKSSAISKARSALRSGRNQLRRDTLASYRRAVSSFQAARKVAKAEVARALEAQALLAQVVRFSAGVNKLNQGSKLLSEYSNVSEPSLDLQKARALLKLADNKTAEATANLKLISDREPTDPEAAVYLGWAHLLAGNFAKARAAFRRALAANERLPSALFGAARVEYKMHNAKQAAVHARAGLALAPNHPGLLLLHGQLIVARKSADALKAWQRVARMSPTTAARRERSDAQTLIGRTHAAAGRKDEARKRFLSALGIHPKNGAAHVGMGMLYYGAGKYRKALSHFEKAGKRREATIMVARTYLAMSKPLDARKVLTKLSKTAPRDAQIRFLLGKSEAQRNLKGAIAHYNTAIKLKAKYFEPYAELAKVYLASKRKAQAFAVLDKASTAMPRSARVKNAIGEAHLLTKNFDKARAYFEEALRMNRSLNLARFNLAKAHGAQGNIAGALKGFEDLRRRDAQFPGLNAALGKIYLASKRYADAAKAFDRALKVDNPTADTRLAAAKAYTQAGKFKKSLLQSETVLRANPTMAVARALRAEARMGQGQLGEALVEIQQAINREKRGSFYEIQGMVLERLKRIGEATDSYKRAIKLSPKRVDLRLRRAKLLIKGGAVKDGLKEINAVITASPERGDAYLYKGIALAGLGKERDARVAYEMAVKKDATLGEAHLKLAQILSDTNRYRRAAHHAELAVKYAAATVTWISEAWYLLATVSHKLGGGRKARAIEAYNKFLDIARRNDPARAVATKALRTLGAPRKTKKKDD